MRKTTTALSLAAMLVAVPIAAGAQTSSSSPMNTQTTPSTMNNGSSTMPQSNNRATQSNYSKSNCVRGDASGNTESSSTTGNTMQRSNMNANTNAKQCPPGTHPAPH